MYTLDDENDKELNSITIILNKSEIKQLIGYAKQLLEEPPSSEHFHLSNADYQKEITLCLCEPKNINNFSARIQRLIKNDE